MRGIRSVGAAVLVMLLAACVATTPGPTPEAGLKFETDFPPGALREHLALDLDLGHRGKPGERHFTFYQFADHPFNVGPAWCTTRPEQTRQNWEHMRWALSADGVTVPLMAYPLTDAERVTGVCRLWLIVAPGLPPGEHEFVYSLTIDREIVDGTYRYPPGEYVTRLRVRSIVRATPAQPARPPRPSGPSRES